MTLPNSLKWITGVLLAPVVLAALLIAIFGWNWLRGPIERMAAERTGRVLAINGDLTLKLGWPLPHIRATSVTFANPAWAREKQMLTADAVDVTIHLPQLLARNIVLPEIRLERPVVFLEQAGDGRRNWLLDLEQQDEEARIRIDRLSLDQGRLGYDDVAQKTGIRAELSTSGVEPNAAEVSFSAQGQFKGMPLKASGKGGPVLGLRDEATPYPLQTEFTVGHTAVKAAGTITSLLKFSAVDMRLAVRGDSLAQLFPLLGLAFPDTRAYTTEGHLLHQASTWRYEEFSGRIGGSDIAGSLEVNTAGKRPTMKADLVSQVLDIADLGPVVGVKPGSVQAARQAAPVPKTAPTPTMARVLPDMPFKTDRWDSVDSEVTLKAKTIRHAKELPLDNLMVHWSLRDSVLTLDPLTFGVAGGQLNGVITLDGRSDTIQAHARLKARKIQLSKLFPTSELGKTSIGQVNGDFDLAGKGNSVRRMLASSNGKVDLVVAGGKISKLMMEKVGLHLWEMLELKMAGDRLVTLRCAVAGFDVRQGNMEANALIFDTEVTTIIGTGSIDLAEEKLDITLNQKTKYTSPLALRSPIYVRGTFAQPTVAVDKGHVAARALGAVALGLVNPLLILIPLIDAGPGQDSDCGELVREAKTLPQSAGKKP